MTARTERVKALSRRDLLKGAALLVGGGAAGAGFGPAQFAFAQAPAATAPATVPETGTSLILLGTQGGPNINLTRGEAASVVLVDGRPYLVDCGYGTLRALVQAGIAFNNVTNVFITHLHDDHTSDIAALLSHKWTGSSAAGPQPTTVHGPFGSIALVEAAIAYFKANTEIRSVDEGRTVKPEQVFFGRDLAAPKITEVFHDDRVTVKAVENTHFPERAKERMDYRSFAYRFETATRSIVFSGDTAYSPALIELARGADYFVCEIMSVAFQQQSAARAATAPANTESIGRHVLETHSSTEDVGKMATAAKVKTVVLNHLLPGATGQRGGAADSANDPYSADVKKFFSGEVIVGQDQMRL